VTGGTRRSVLAVLAGLAAGAVVVAALRLGWLLGWPRALLGGVLVAAAAAALTLVALSGDLLGPGRWPDPPEPERVAGWPQLSLVADLTVVAGALHVPSERRMGSAYALAWAHEDYGAMYALLSDATQARTSRASFRRAYEQAADTLTLERVVTGKVRKDGHEGTSNVGPVGDQNGRSAGQATNVVTDYVLVHGRSVRAPPASLRGQSAISKAPAGPRTSGARRPANGTGTGACRWCPRTLTG